MTEEEVRSLLEGEFVLDVNKFTKYNPGKTSGWFKLSNGWMNDLVLSRLPQTDQLFFLRLCTIRSTSGGPLRSLGTTSLQHRAGFRGRSVVAQLINLWNHGLIILEPSLRKKERKKERSSTDPFGSDETDLFEFEKTEVAPPPTSPQSPGYRPSPEELESLYAEYPRKEGKAAGLKRLRSIATSPEVLERVRAAIHAYKAHLAKNKTEPRFVKHFGTFVSIWEDWLDPDAGYVEPVQVARDPEDEKYWDNPPKEAPCP